jgi:hypothetical protein
MGAASATAVQRPRQPGRESCARVDSV